MKDSAVFWDWIAERYARSRIPDMEKYLHTLERTRTHLKPEDRVLEVGCGTASTALALAMNVREMVVSDISSKMIAIGREKATATGVNNIRFVVGDVGAEAIGNQPYDAVMAFNMLHLVEDIPSELFRIAARVKKGGLFISKTICLGGGGVPLKVKAFMLAVPLLRLMGLAPKVKTFSVETLDAMVRSAGFEIIEAGNFPASPPRRYLVARKI
ncbi:MAG TPA: class I SAM-dependent methyltransferase [Rhabdaerophilum sp.]|nr:class I SAM-dependent methyltransferase [Rhabdaerophilum sp.]